MVETTVVRMDVQTAGYSAAHSVVCWVAWMAMLWAGQMDKCWVGVKAASMDMLLVDLSDASMVVQSAARWVASMEYLTVVWMVASLEAWMVARMVVESVDC